MGRSAVDRATEVELADDLGGVEEEDLLHRGEDLLVGDLARTEGVEVDAGRLRVADGVGDLQFAAFGGAGRDDVLGDPAGHVGRGTVDLGRILAREGAAAVAAHASVRVDDDLTAGEAAIALGAADDEASGRVDQVFGLLADEFLREDLADDLLDAELLDLAVRDVVGMLGRDDHVLDGDGAAVDVADGDLRLAVRAQPFGALGAGLAEAGQLAVEAVGEHDRGGHELGGLGGGVTEHDALVAGAHLGVLLALGLALVDALGDVRGLLGEQVGDEDLVGVEDVVVVHVADVADRGADDFLEVDLGLGGEFAGDDDVVALDQGLAGDAGEPVLRETGVEDGIRDAVGDLVRVALADGFGREDEGGVACHKAGETNGRSKRRQAVHPIIWIGRCVIAGGLRPIPAGGSGWRLAVRKHRSAPEARLTGDQTPQRETG